MRRASWSCAILPALLVAGCGDGCLGGEDAEGRVERARESLERAGEVAREVGEDLGEVATEVALPPAREEQLGDRMAAEIAAEATLVESGPAVEYMRRVGQSLVEQAEDRSQAIDFDFHLLDDPEINAFAIPGGHIYLTTGLLRAAESEAEIAAVLAHEIAHVTSRHIAQRMTALYGVSLLTRLALGEDPGMLEQIATELLAQGFLLKHSRDNEREADAAGLDYVIAAGYSPRGYAAFFERILEQPRPPAILSTHPDPAERIEAAERMLADLDAQVLERPMGEAAHARAAASL